MNVILKQWSVIDKSAWNFHVASKFQSIQFLTLLLESCKNSDYKILSLFPFFPNWSKLDYPWTVLMLGNTKSMQVYFNCASFWLSPIGLFDCQLQAQMRHNFHFSAWHVQDIYRINMCSGHDQYHIWDYSFYLGKYTHRWNLMVVAEPNGNNSLFLLILTVLLHELTHI